MVLQAVKIWVLIWLLEQPIHIILLRIPGMRAYKVTFELRIVGRSVDKWNFLLYDIGGA